MMEIMKAAVDLDAPAARAIAAAMRELAQVDGEHPRELALIDAFEAELPAAEAAELSALGSPEAQEALLKSLVLLAFADGKMSEPERAHIVRTAAGLGLGEAEVAKATADVATVILSGFSGVHIFRDQVTALGRELGLDDATIQRVLG